MPDIQVKIENIQHIKAAFRLSPTLMRRELKRAINTSLLLIGRAAVKRTPVLTGRLRASILGGNFQGGRFASNSGVSLASTNVLTGTVGTEVEYAGFVHDGTKYMRARPFMELAVLAENRSVQNEFEMAVKNVLDEIGSKSR